MFTPDLEQFNKYETGNPLPDRVFEYISLETLQSYETFLKLLECLIQNGLIALIKPHAEGRHIKDIDLFIMENLKDEEAPEKGYDLRIFRYFVAERDGDRREASEISINYIVTQLMFYVSFVLQLNSYVVNEFYEMNDRDLKTLELTLYRIEKVLDGGRFDDKSEHNLKAVGSEDNIFIFDLNAILFWAVCIALKEESIEELRKKVSFFRKVWLKPES